jgi:hypothetical protein
VNHDKINLYAHALAALAIEKPNMFGKTAQMYCNWWRTSQRIKYIAHIEKNAEVLPHAQEIVSKVIQLRLTK